MRFDTPAAPIPFTPLRFDRSSIREHIVRLLRAKIVAGELVAGVLYSAPGISEQLSVSVTPVREAILELAKEDLVRISPHRGFRVHSPTDEELDRLVELRIDLEVPAMRRLARTRDKPDYSAFRQMALEIRDHAAHEDMVSFVALDRDFHLTLTALLGDPLRTRIIGNLRDQTRLVGLSTSAAAGSLVSSANEHTELIELLERGDAAAVGRLMRRHLNHIRGVWAGRPEGC